MLTLATRKSPLALAQTEMLAALLRDKLGEQVSLLKITTTGDKQIQWSLEKRGGKGLFTTELEQALLRGEADLAVHSTKDLPGEMTGGLGIAGYLPRADPRDVLVKRIGIAKPKTIATGSPRRRLQLLPLFPGAAFSEIRGNIDTRLRKIAQDQAADASVLAAAGLSRLGISSWEGLEFQPLGFEQMVPAVGQAAIAVQCRASETARFAALLDAETARRVGLERALQSLLGGGCHTAFAAHATPSSLHLFHEQCGPRLIALHEEDFDRPLESASRILRQLQLIS
jgi:hydroxymethylbilane synthase